MGDQGIGTGSLTEGWTQREAQRGWGAGQGRITIIGSGVDRSLSEGEGFSDTTGGERRHG